MSMPELVECVCSTRHVRSFAWSVFSTLLPGSHRSFRVRSDFGQYVRRLVYGLYMRTRDGIELAMRA